MIAALIEGTLRRERIGILASLFRVTRDLDLAEEALQEACARAIQAWPQTGAPDKPGAWLSVVARNWLIDRARKGSKEALVAGLDKAGGPHLRQTELEHTEPEQSATHNEDSLKLVFACCASELPERSRVCLALRSLLGLSTREIARAYLEPEATTAQRLVRAKRQIRSQADQELPAGNERHAAIQAVLTTLYLVFNEGYLSTTGQDLLRRRLMEDAIQLAEVVTTLLPYDPEALGLAAMMYLQASRHEARTDAAGALIPLEEQDRSKWDAGMIARGQGLLERVLAMHHGGGASTGPYQLQAAIAALHCQAPRAEDTDWLQIAALYRRLVELSPSPVIELNAAVALAMTGQLKDGLSWVNALERRGVLDSYHLLPAVKAGLLHRAGHLKQARRYYGRARRLARNQGEQHYLTRRIDEVERELNEEKGQHEK